MRIDAKLEVRHPYVGEVPAELMRGFEAFSIDPQWQWVLIDEGQVKAQLLTANVHGLLYMLRLTALPDAPRGWAVRLFRAVLREAREKGLIGYMVLLTDATGPELKLMKIVQRHSGYMQPITGVLAAGRLELTY